MRVLTFPAKRGISLKTLKTETSDSLKDWFAVGEYKHFPNKVGGEPTTAPKIVCLSVVGRLYVYPYNLEGAAKLGITLILNAANPASDCIAIF